jgi:acetyl-CoA carboxylase biotin carboxyl carrier protein
MIDLKTLRELVKLMVANDLSEMDLQDQGERVSLKRGKGDPQVHYLPGTHAAAAGTASATPGNGSAVAAGPSGGGGGATGTSVATGSSGSSIPGSAIPGSPTANGAASPAGDSGLITINSPMVGTFYASPNPDSKHFAAVGDRISPDSVVCIIEAMKVFNEIKAEKAGVIEKILVTNGQAVEFGQPLFSVRPS